MSNAEHKNAALTTVIQRFGIVVDGVAAVGEITVRIPRLMTVKLVEPYGVLISSVSVALFAAQHVDLTGPAGDVEAVNMLRMLAIKAKRFKEHRHKLRRLWDETQRQLAEVDRTDVDRPEVLALLKRESRAQFRAGRVSQTDYGRALKHLRARAASFDSRERAVTESFMATRLWPERGVDLGQVIPFLEAIERTADEGNEG